MAPQPQPQLQPQSQPQRQIRDAAAAAVAASDSRRIEHLDGVIFSRVTNRIEEDEQQWGSASSGPRTDDSGQNVSLEHTAARVKAALETREEYLTWAGLGNKKLDGQRGEARLPALGAEHLRRRGLATAT